MIRQQRALRWLAVTLLVGVLTAVPSLISALPAPRVPIAPIKLLRAIRGSVRVGYQGLAESNARLGLPNLERAGRVAALLGGKTRLRAWYRGPNAWRVDDLTPIAEHGTYLDRDGIWVWDSARRTGTRVEGFTQVRFPRPADLLPPELARRLVNAAGTFQVSALPSARIAGRDAAGLRVHPSAPDTTVGWVDIWADPHSGLPLRVEVASRSTSSIVISSSFLEVSDKRPSASLVRFEIPRGAVLNRTDAPDFAQAVDRYSPFVLPDTMDGMRRTVGFRAARVYGRGFGAIAVLALPSRFSPLSQDEIDKLQPVPGPWEEGAMARTPLLNGLMVERGGVLYMLGGAVTGHALVQAALDLIRHPPVFGRGCC